MKYPILSELTTSRQMIDAFGGYNHNLRIGNGEFYDMTNLSSNDYPVLSPRPVRGVYASPKSPQGMIAKDSLCYVDGGNFIINEHNEHKVYMELNAEPKTLISMGAYVIIMPDKKYINTADLSDYKGGKNAQRALSEKIRSFYSSRRIVTPKAKKRGIPQLLGLKPRTPFDAAFAPLTASPFVFADNNQGILPLLVRVMQNNYQGGIKKFEFTRRGDELFLTSHEGEKKYEYKVGIYGYEFTSLDYCGEKYTVGALARCVGKDSSVYEIEFIFPELPNSRLMRLSLLDSGLLKVEMTENPDSEIAASFIDSLPAMSPKISFALSMLESSLGKNFIKNRLEEVFSPTLHAVAENAPDFDILLSEEERKIKEKLASYGMVRMLISRFTGVKSEEDENKKPPSLGGLFLSSILGKFFS